MYDAILFDLLSALLDSWTLWDDVAGSAEAGRRWRLRYLKTTYATGAYRPYPELLTETAVASGLDAAVGRVLVDRWDDVLPWPEAGDVTAALAARFRVGVVTNCSIELGNRAAARVGTPFHSVTTAEEAGAYKPLAIPYEAALAALGTTAERTLFVAGSPGDVRGASAVGMRVVWHNRARLAAPGEGPRPLRVISRLEPLLRVAG